MEPLVEYRKAVQERLNNADVLVAKLVHENGLAAQELENKQQELELLRSRLDERDDRLRQADKARAAAVEELDIARDLFEHLCGVRVHKSYEDDSGLWFDTSQGGKCGVMDYKLGFVRGDADKTEVIYVPLLKQRSADELQRLQRQLPGYMFDTLSFPLASLSQFYSKLARGLSRRANPTGRSDENRDGADI
ncbi:LAMI_0A01134g1_1 [Lachancea mirantina]|uniref:LAMI_0A01134g1_1 n=1 Tax=Lachancea mirantina TaxID=1230905 RepID=A0A1G4ILN9_9SACH|nr:LAMI_0A01134g1_1 [Lachancea mirantina]